MPTTLNENRPSAGIGVVEVQKLDPLRGSEWSRCKNSRVFCDFVLARATLWGSAWSRCKNSRFFAVLFWLARPSAGIGVVEVQKLEVFCNFVLARATLRGDQRGRGAKTSGFLRLLLFELVLGSCLVVRAPAPGTGGSRVRFTPGPRAGFASCAEQLA